MKLNSHDYNWEKIPQLFQDPKKRSKFLKSDPAGLNLD